MFNLCFLLTGKLFRIFSLVILAISHAYAADGDISTDSREQRVAKMAQQAILTQLLILRNPTSHALCQQNSYACLGPDPAELGLTILGLQPGIAADTALVKLLRYRIDAGLSEDYFCYMLQRGKRVSGLLAQLNAAQMHQNCQLEVATEIKKRAPLFDTLKAEAICASESEIQGYAKELLEAIHRGAVCDPQDF